jgi:hypothetical protein
MQFKTLFIFAIAISFAMSGCGGATNTNVTNANLPNANTSVPATNSAVLVPTPKPEEPTTNNAPTLGPVINAYYDALRKKDAAGARKVMGQQFIQSVEADMKEENKTDIVAFLTEFDKIPDGKMEARNEQINGSKGSAEVKGGSYANWTKVTFVNEGGAWKVTNEFGK